MIDETERRGTTPAMYYRYFVEPNQWDFTQSPSDVRLACNAATSAFHLSDVFQEFYRRHDPARLPHQDRRGFIRSLGHDYPAFRVVQSVATIFKHFYVSKPYLDGSSPQSIGGMVHPATGIAINARWRKLTGPYVSLRRKDGTEASLNEALRVVVDEMWPTILGADLDDPNLY